LSGEIKFFANPENKNDQVAVGITPEYHAATI
jgi:hypothetical protein